MKAMFSSSWTLRLLLSLVGLAVAVVLVHRLPKLPALQKVEDFGAYWAAARLNREGGNPYSVEQLRPLELEIDPARTEILQLLNPPWVLALMLPFGTLDFQPARLLWLLIQVGLLVFSAGALWRLYGGSEDRHILAWLLCFSYFPTLQMLGLGQVSVLILAGVLGFVLLEKECPLGAGMAAALTLVKPQLPALFWVVLGLWCLEHRRWFVILGAAGTLLGLTLIAWLCNPHVFADYRDLWASNPAARWLPPTPGSLLRLWLGKEQVWLNFVFPLLGLLWVLWYYWSRRRDWSWADQFPVLMLACYLTTAYGWAYDQVILLPALLQGAVWTLARPLGVRLLALAVYLALTGLAVWMNVAHCDELLFFWTAPALLVGYLLLMPRGERRPSCS